MNNKNINENNLTSDQSNVFNKLKMKQNLLITGPAGTGKSFIIEYFKNWCKKHSYEIYLTAMTGCAAWLIGGNTLHSWAGIGCGTKDYRSLLKKIRRNKKVKERWLNTEVLIIDEVSMLTKDLFDKLNIIGKILRKSELPFGGIQIILTGDFYQLPPINDNKNEIVEEIFCFESDNWDTSIDETIELKEIVRQVDPEFQKCLNEVRIGNCSIETKKLLHKCAQKKWNHDNGIIPTRLYSKNENVNMINDLEIRKLCNEIKEYKTNTTIEKEIDACIDNEYIDTIQKYISESSNFESDLKLAIGAQVMLLINLDVENGLVNGSRGVIIDFDEKNLPIVRFMNGIEKKIKEFQTSYNYDPSINIIKTQIPLKLAWAISIHKIQGSTLDLVEISIGKNIFEYGQSYVALSRVKSLEGLYITSLKFNRIKAHPKVIEFYNNINKKTVNKKKITQYFASC